MAPTIDGTTPARVGPSVSATQTTASFSPPANSLLVACCTVDTSGTTNTTITMSNTGSIGSWAENSRHGGNEGGGRPGTVAIHTAPVTSAPGSITATMTSSIGGRNTTLKLYVVTLASTTIGGVSEGDSAATNVLNTTSQNTTATDSLMFCVANESDSGPGNPTSSNATIDAYNSGGNHSGYSGYIAGGPSGSGISFNVDAAGAGTVTWNWVVVEILAAATPVVPPAPTRRQRLNYLLPR